MPALPNELAEPAPSPPLPARIAEAKSIRAAPIDPQRGNAAAEIVPLQTALIGLDEGQAEKLLGAPSEVEDGVPGKVLRYRSLRCTVDLSLYPDVQTRVFRTLSYKIISNDDADDRACLAELRSHARAK